MADDHFEKIQQEHADLVSRLEAQRQKVADYNIANEQKIATEEAIRAQQEREKAMNEAQNRKDEMTFKQKQVELDIKKQALNAI